MVVCVSSGGRLGSGTRSSIGMISNAGVVPTGALRVNSGMSQNLVVQGRCVATNLSMGWRPASLRAQLGLEEGLAGFLQVLVGEVAAPCHSVRFVLFLMRRVRCSLLAEGAVEVRR